MELSNETYNHLSNAERQKMSADYVSLARYAYFGTPKHMRIMEKAIRLDPRNELAWKRMSAPYLSRGLYEQWHDFSDKAIKLNPKAWQGWRGFQKLFYFRDYGGALYDLDATDTLTVNKTDYAENYSVDYLRGLCYLGLKNYHRSKEFFELYLDKESKDTGSNDIDQTAYVYLAIIENDYQRYESAIKFLEKVDDEDIAGDMHYQLAYAQFMLGKVSEAHANIGKSREELEEGNYHKNNQYEVMHQLYDSQIEELSSQIECFL